MAPVTADKLAKKKETIELLLAKAASTTFPAEAELAMEQATKLMLQFGFERAEFNGENKKSKKMTQKHFDCVGIYHLGKVLGFTAVAGAFQSVSVVQGKYGNLVRMYIIGEEGDVDDVIRILISIDAQAEHAVKAWWKDNPYRGLASKMEGYLARRQFIESFGYGVASKVREQMTTEGQGKELVLADRVKDAVAHRDELYPQLRTIQTRRHGGGYGAGAAGREAGTKAHLGGKAIK